MRFSLETKTASLSVGDFAEFALGPREGGGGSAGLWRAQLGQHWHHELRQQVEHELAASSTAASFEIAIAGELKHRGWTLALGGRIDQLVGTTLREIKTVTRPLPLEEDELRADFGSYFLQLATYVILRRLQGAKDTRAELVFVEASSGLSQTIALNPFDEALVHHQLDAVVQFLELQHRAAERRHALRFHSPFATLRPGQETIQADLNAAFAHDPIVLLEAPTGYGKTGCVLEFALASLRDGRFDRLIWLTGKSTGQLQVVETLRRMTTPPQDHPGGNTSGWTPVAFWQVRNKREHCVNDVFHCVRDGCDYLAGAPERWPQSGLSRFHLDHPPARDLDTLRAAGRAARICPYEITRTALAFNDVWIGDFNYVFAPDNRGLFFDQPGFDPSRTLLVIDEAHNLPSRVADAFSHAAGDQEIRALLAELDHQRAPAPLVLAVEVWARVLGSIEPCEVLDGALEADVRAALARLAELVAVTPLDHAALGPHHSETLWNFAQLHDFLDDLHLHRLLWSRRTGTLEFTCIDAADAIGDTLRSFGGALLMSATLAPFDQFALACGHSRYTPVRAVAPWRGGAYDVAVDLRISTSFRERANYYGTTADTIGALHASAGRAIVVFFPSYAYAEAALRALEHSGSVLRATLQPKLPDLAAQAAWVEETLTLADALFLVLGSSFAESIDLLGGRVSHAMVVGPALPEVNAVQKARTDSLSSLGREAAFRRVYQIPGLQKVNQALGRLVRSPGHRAKVLLHCRRFAESNYASLLDPECQHYREITTTTELREWLASA
ncbi:MAG: helicase C-terminal domain-containing protein [Candidatus Didemnitutus sp.]|nr:helicase C-terminal domain-containing protein [Candidatus Didemnitutus sp.]